jgi:molybdopterin synthase catalytic subunit/molybdopterin converting factor small subunit
MRIRLLAFASAGDALGASEMTVELPEGAGVAGLRGWLDERYPALAPLWPRLAVAVDGAVAAGDAPLHDGQEVALLPPVSGGIDPATPRWRENAAVARPRVELVEGPIDPQDVMARVAAPAHGAVLLFLGTVRDRTRRPEEAAAPPHRVVKLTYSAYRPMALRVLDRIAGEVAAGEASVAIAAAAPHRAAAYEGSRRALERLKAEVPIWKREHFAGGEAVWREEESLRGR